ncbi:MAG: DUF2059 domain-containing protein [Pseudomonadota bacterium]
MSTRLNDLHRPFPGRIVLPLAVLAIAACALIYSSSSWAQQKQFAQSHLDAAHEAVFITRTSRAYNEVIPLLAERARAHMVERRPDLKDDIEEAIGEAALNLVERQGELDLLIARSWAARFSEEELRDITAFFATPTGSKLARMNTELIAVGLEIARLWGAERGEEMIELVRQNLKEKGHEF